MCCNGPAWVTRTDLSGTTIFHPSPQHDEPGPPIRPWGTGQLWLGWGQGHGQRGKFPQGKEGLPQDNGQSGEGDLIVPGGVTLPEQTGEGRGRVPGTHAAGKSSTVSEHPRKERAGGTGGSFLLGVGDPGGSDSGHKKLEGTVKGSPYQQEWPLILRTFTPEVLSLESLQSEHCQRECPLQEAWRRGWGHGLGGLAAENGGRREALTGALTAESGAGWEEHCPAAPLPKEGTPREGGWSTKKDELSQGELTQSL